MQKSLESKETKGLLKLERKLKDERRETLLQEEVLLKQKQGLDWLKWGDGNTKFFHTSTLIRRRRNKFEALLNKNGEWVEGSHELNDMAREFYAELFTSDPTTRREFIRVISHA